MDSESKAHERFIRFLRTSQRILIFTGAGVSTGSGIPDFRGAQGVWTRRQPVYYHDFMQSEEARIEHWDYKLEGWSAFREAQPNAVHEAIVNLEHAGKLLLLVTQNIDELHARAGTSLERLVELHGTNLLVECQVRSSGGFTGPVQVLRDEALAEADGCRLQEPTAIAARWTAGLAKGFEVRFRIGAPVTGLVIALGSSLSVYPAASIPLLAARRGVPYVVINRGPTGQVTSRLEGDVTELFPTVIRAAWAQS